VTSLNVNIKVDAISAMVIGYVNATKDFVVVENFLLSVMIGFPAASVNKQNAPFVEETHNLAINIAVFTNVNSVQNSYTNLLIKMVYVMRTILYVLSIWNRYNVLVGVAEWCPQ